ncbi:MAG: hypothetical protein OQJ89_01015, partial [Kangiellaceae bacterium]|nr:hypothetical protein [Kangiellaceae bacterium]
CRLTVNNQCVSMRQQAAELLRKLGPFADLLDQVYSTTDHRDVLQKLEGQLANLDQTLSGQIVKSIEQRQDGFFPYAMELALRHKAHFEGIKMNGGKLAEYQAEAELSFKQKAEMEASDSISFEEFLNNYYK